MANVMKPLMDKKVMNLSGGELQRVALCLPSEGVVAHPRDSKKMEATVQARFARGDRQVFFNGGENFQGKTYAPVGVIPNISGLSLLVHAATLLAKTPALSMPPSFAQVSVSSQMTP